MKFFNIFGVYASRFPYLILSIKSSLESRSQLRNFVNVTSFLFNNNSSLPLTFPTRPPVLIPAVKIFLSSTFWASPFSESKNTTKSFKVLFSFPIYSCLGLSGLLILSSLMSALNKSPLKSKYSELSNFISELSKFVQKAFMTCFNTFELQVRIKDCPVSSLPFLEVYFSVWKWLIEGYLNSWETILRILHHSQIDRRQKREAEN